MTSLLARANEIFSCSSYTIMYCTSTILTMTTYVRTYVLVDRYLVQYSGCILLAPSYSKVMFLVYSSWYTLLRDSLGGLGAAGELQTSETIATSGSQIVLSCTVQHRHTLTGATQRMGSWPGSTHVTASRSRQVAAVLWATHSDSLTASLGRSIRQGQTHGRQIVAVDTT